MQNGDFVPLVEAGIDLFERSEFLIATSQEKKIVRVFD